MILSEEDVEWVVNDNAELGVKIKDQFFFLYKGGSLAYHDAKHDDGSPMMWRPVLKREFGECAHPINYDDPTKIGTVSLNDGHEWFALPAAFSADRAAAFDVSHEELSRGYMKVPVIPRKEGPMTTERDRIYGTVERMVREKSGFEGPITDDIHLHDDLALDSLDAVGMMLDCEDVLSVRIGDEDERFFQGRLGDLVDFLTRRVER